jgi:hypothetical protein
LNSQHWPWLVVLNILAFQFPHLLSEILCMKYIMQFNALCLLSALEYTSQSCSNKVLFTDEKTHPEEFVPLHLNPKFLVGEKKLGLNKHNTSEAEWYCNSWQTLQSHEHCWIVSLKLQNNQATHITWKGFGHHSKTPPNVRGSRIS